MAEGARQALLGIISTQRSTLEKCRKQADKMEAVLKSLRSRYVDGGGKKKGRGWGKSSTPSGKGGGKMSLLDRELEQVKQALVDDALALFKLKYRKDLTEDQKKAANSIYEAKKI